MWREVERKKGKPTKPPFNARTGELAKSTEPATWASHDLASARLVEGGFLGLGFVINECDDLLGVDFDDCVDDAGTMKPEVAGWLDRFGSYAEVSPSGKGVRVFLRGTLDLPDGQDGVSCDKDTSEKAIYGHRREMPRQGAGASEGCDRGHRAVSRDQ